MGVDEGQQAANTGTFSDVGVNDVVTLSASIGTVVDTGNGTWSWTYDTTDGPDESQVVTITATDNDGGVTTRDFTLDVANVAPQLTVESSERGGGWSDGRQRRYLFGFRSGLGASRPRSVTSLTTGTALGAGLWTRRRLATRK